MLPGAIYQFRKYSDLKEVTLPASASDKELPSR